MSSCRYFFGNENLLEDKVWNDDLSVAHSILPNSWSDVRCLFIVSNPKRLLPSPDSFSQLERSEEEGETQTEAAGKSETKNPCLLTTSVH